MLVVLRLALGCHFLYEGVWKIRHADLFVGETEGFLSGARGPMAGFFYAMVPDLDGHQRLEGNLTEVNDADGKSTKVLKLAKSWDDLRQRFVDFYRPAVGADNTKKLHDQFANEAKKVYDRHVRGLDEFVKENGDKIKAHFESLKRFEDGRKADPRTMFQTQRRWDEMQDLRKEAKGWISDLDSRENALKGDLLNLLSKDRKPEVEAVALAAKKDKEAAAKAEAKKTADAAAKKPAETDKKPEGVKPKTSVDEKPANPAKDKTGESAKAKSKEMADSGSEESDDAEASKTTAKKDVKKSETKPQASEKSKEKAADTQTDAAADATVVVVDFSSLADGRPENGPFAASPNPLTWKRVEQLAFLLTWSLFGIGLCLVLGLFTRPAALAGAGFMLFVVMSQPSYPGVYPLDPPQLGHALLVNKDFVEMIALLVIASTCLGRWTGLDFFIHTFLIKPFCCKCCNETTTEGRKA